MLFTFQTLLIVSTERDVRGMWKITTQKMVSSITSEGIGCRTAGYQRSNYSRYCLFQLRCHVNHKLKETWTGIIFKFINWFPIRWFSFSVWIGVNSIIINRNEILRNNVWWCKLDDRLCGLVVRVMATDPEVPGWIFWEYWVWNGVHSASWVQLKSYMKEKPAAPV
jgi:hypothetical protein